MEARLLDRETGEEKAKRYLIRLIEEGYFTREDLIKAIDHFKELLNKGAKK